MLITKRTIDDALGVSDRQSLTHLRRVVKPDALSLKTQSQYPDLAEQAAAPISIRCELPQSTKPLDEESATGRTDSEHCWNLHILLCRTTALPFKNVSALLSAIEVLDTANISSRLYKTVVPLSSPSSEDQAREWSSTYWPTTYKKYNPHGPQHNIVKDAVLEMSADAQTHMRLAERAGTAARQAEMGIAVGATIIHRSSAGLSNTLAVAGDARWYQIKEGYKSGGGNPLAHSVMRAIGMLAYKRLQSDRGLLDVETDTTDYSSFVDAPLTSVEHEIHSNSIIEAGGYLCLDLELYVTHEPCVMCSMAILHSRFGRVIFGTQMLSTGGLIAETRDAPPKGLGYGLLWRPALNWKCLVWQYVEGYGDEPLSIDEDWHA